MAVSIRTWTNGTVDSVGADLGRWLPGRGPSEYEKAKAALAVAKADLDEAIESSRELKQLTSQLDRSQWPEDAAWALQYDREKIEAAVKAAKDRLRALAG